MSRGEYVVFQISLNINHSLRQTTMDNDQYRILHRARRVMYRRGNQPKHAYKLRPRYIDIDYNIDALTAKASNRCKHDPQHPHCRGHPDDPM